MIIGIGGKSGSGKDTIAEFLQARYGFSYDQIASPLKSAVKALFSLSDAEVYDRELRGKPLAGWPGWTVRKLLQLIGDLLRDNIDGQILVKSLCRRLNNRGQTPSDWVIPDVRLPNETEMLRSVFGKDFVMMRVTRPGFDGRNIGGIEGHKTEQYDLDADYTFANDSTKEDLWKEVEAVMEKLLGRTGQT